MLDLFVAARFGRARSIQDVISATRPSATTGRQWLQLLCKANSAELKLGHRDSRRTRIGLDAGGCRLGRRVGGGHQLG